VSLNEWCIVIISSKRKQKGKTLRFFNIKLISLDTIKFINFNAKNSILKQKNQLEGFSSFLCQRFSESKKIKLLQLLHPKF